MPEQAVLTARSAGIFPWTDTKIATELVRLEHTASLQNVVFYLEHLHSGGSHAKEGISVKASLTERDRERALQQSIRGGWSESPSSAR